MSPIRFLHIPKTAGSTFSRVLRQQYPGKRYFNFTGDIVSDLEKFKTLSAKEKKEIAFFSGHAPIVTGIPEADQTIITFLRDPVSRVKSFCQHVSEGKSPYLRDEFPPDGFSLDDFLNSDNVELYNLQTKMLINTGVGATSELLDRLSDSEAIQRAKSNLFEKIVCFGIQEYFDESLFLFADRFDWKISPYESINKMDIARKLQFTNKQIDKIIELNTIDIEVYKIALDSFRQPAKSKNPIIPFRPI